MRSLRTLSHIMILPMNLLATSTLSAIAFFAVSHGAAADEKTTIAFIEQHCADCHDASEKKGGFDITTLGAEFTNADNFAKWVKVLDRTASGEMPPKKKERPPAAESAAFLGSLTKALTDADGRATNAGGGRTTVRRMNRAEYEHALRDLLALPLLRVKEWLPEDGQQFGFDKVAGALDISHVQMTKYLQTADVALRQAVVKVTARPELVKWHEPAAEQDSMRGALAVHSAVPLVGRELAPGLTTHVVGNPQADYGNTYRGATFQGKADSAAVSSRASSARISRRGFRWITFAPQWRAGIACVSLSGVCAGNAPRRCQQCAI